MQEDADNLIAKVRGIYGFKVKNGPNGREGYWVIDAKTAKGSIQFNGKGKILLLCIMLFQNVIPECYSRMTSF
jgi:hypothetical protein